MMASDRGIRPCNSHPQLPKEQFNPSKMPNPNLERQSLFKRIFVL
jgi:hypothetical protein